jgi:cell wall-associated NlpC family hydrolase
MFFMSGSGAVLSRGGSGSGTDSGQCVSPAVSGGYANPLVGQLTSGFGSRPNPFGAGVVPEGFTDESELTFHAGQDIAGVPQRTPFYSASGGTVRKVDYGGSAGGNGIIIDAGNNTEFWYWHAADGTSKVKAGQTIKAGDELAGVGSTGASTAPHLHFEIHVNGKPVDPGPYMTERGITVGVGGTPNAVPASDREPSIPAIQGALAVKGPNGKAIPFSAEQMTLVSTIVSEGKRAGVPTNGLLIALMVALQESSGINTYANTTVPESLNYPHMKVGSDHDSVNAFQQRPSQGWGTVKKLMDPVYAAQAFYGGKEGPNQGSPRGLLDIPGWEQMSLGEAGQTVQGSAFPDAYDKWRSTAQQLLDAAGGAIPAQCTPGADQPITSTDNADIRKKIIEAANQGVGGSYVWGGTTFQAWDCSGYVQWIYNQAGIKLPRVNQWTVGTKTTDPQPGDLVVQRKSGPEHWEHVGIYAGNGQMYSALNPSEGTLLHTTVWESDTEYFKLLK